MLPAESGGSGGGLFPHYRADAGAIETAGNNATHQQTVFSALKTNLAGQEDAASREASGVIHLPVGTCADVPKADAEKAGLASLVAGAATTHFAKAVRTYNKHIDRLNEEYENARARDFDVAADAGHEECNTDAENTAARDGKVAAADTALRNKLEKERQGYEDDLDDSADFAATMLIIGPTEETILSLVVTGDIDLSGAADALGTTIAALNNFRMSVATAQTIQSWKDLFPALVKGDWKRLEKAVLPANLFGKYGYLPRHSAKVGKAFTAFSKFGKFAGRAFPPLAVLAGGYGLYDTVTNWKGSFDDWNKAVGSTATVVGGGLATAAMIATAVGVAFPPAGLVIAGVAGVIAVGSLAVTYREEIWDGIKWTGEAIADGAGWIYDKTGLDSAVEGLGNAWDTGMDWAAGVGSGIVEDTGDLLEGAGDLLEGAGDLIDDIPTPW
ncbi:MAG: hypothetical protein ACRDO7_15240 [Nocardioidaceae bacterium]